MGWSKICMVLLKFIVSKSVISASAGPSGRIEVGSGASSRSSSGGVSLVGDSVGRDAVSVRVSAGDSASGVGGSVGVAAPLSAEAEPGSTSASPEAAGAGARAGCCCSLRTQQPTNRSVSP